MEVKNPRWPHTVEIERIIPGKGDDENPFSDDDAAVEDTFTMLYSGCGRSFTDTTTEGNNNVDLNKRKASIPVRFDEWDEGQKPTDGDTIRVKIGRNTETGIVKDCESDNDRTLVYWNLRRV